MSTAGGTAAGTDAAHRRRAWGVGGALFLCVAVAAVVVALNDLRVREAAGQRYLQALADSHGRQVGLEIDSVERAFRGLVADLVAIREVAPDAAPDLVRHALVGIAARNVNIGDLRVGDAPPAFVPGGRAEPRRLYLGRPARNADGTWYIPLAMMLLEPGAGDGRWLLGALDVEAFGGVLRAHEVGEHGVASILTRDGMLIARSDSGTRHAGLDAAGSPVFQALAWWSRAAGSMACHAWSATAMWNAGPWSPPWA